MSDAGATGESDTLPPGVGDRLGPEYLGNRLYGDRDRIPTNHGPVRINHERLIRFRNGARQEVVSGHYEVRCPACYTTHEVEGTGDDARTAAREAALECCESVRWLPPSDWLDPCPVCGRSHRERHECTAPVMRDPVPDRDQPAICTDCGWSATVARGNLGRNGCCPECDSAAVRFGALEDGDHDE